MGFLLHFRLREYVGFLNTTPPQLKSANKNRLPALYPTNIPALHKSACIRVIVHGSDSANGPGNNASASPSAALALTYSPALML